MSLCISPLEVTLVTNDDFLERFKCNGVIQFVNYMSLCISDQLEVTLLTNDDFLERFKFSSALQFNVAVQFATYMNDAYDLYVICWIPKKEIFEELPSQTNKLIPSNIEAPILALKPLSEHLKYAFLRPNETFSVVISVHINEN